MAFQWQLDHIQRININKMMGDIADDIFMYISYDNSCIRD